MDGLMDGVVQRRRSCARAGGAQQECGRQGGEEAGNNVYDKNYFSVLEDFL
jgi:hypothetical protein